MNCRSASKSSRLSSRCSRVDGRSGILPRERQQGASTTARLENVERELAETFKRWEELEALKG